MGKHYKYTTDWDGQNYCGFHIQWNYKEGYVDISMPNYIQESLKRLGHQPTITPQYSPHHHVPIQYGKKGTRQYADTPDDTKPLYPTETKNLQSTIGSFLFYGRAIDSTTLPVLNGIASDQVKPTEKNQRAHTTTYGLSSHVSKCVH